MPLLSGSLTELVVLTRLRAPALFHMKFNVMIFLLEALIGPLSTTLLQSKYSMESRIALRSLRLEVLFRTISIF